MATATLLARARACLLALFLAGCAGTPSSAPSAPPAAAEQPAAVAENAAMRIEFDRNMHTRVLAPADGKPPLALTAFSASEYVVDWDGNIIDQFTLVTGIQHAVISTLPHVKQLSGGRLEVPHFDTKGHIEEYARGANLSATYVHVAFYYENFLNHFPPRRQANGTYVFGFPQGTAPLAAVAAEDIGGVVAAIFAESFWYRDKVVGIVGEDLRCDDYAETMHRVLGRSFAYRYVAHDAFAALDFPGARDLAGMFEFNRQYVANRRVDLAKSRELYPEIRPFERWLRGHVPAFERALAS
jgi:uncharacterized protein YbjT (DUF2867 family)